MQGFLFNETVGYLFLVVIAMLLVVHAYVLLRIRNILQAISMNFDTITYFCRKFTTGQAPKQDQQKRIKSCQFCRHRLAYINTSKTKNDEEDFYHVCGIKNIHVGLSDSCEKFDREEANL